MSGGGGIEEVGTVRPTMQMLSWDDKTRPMSRNDMLNFVSNPENLTPREVEIITNSAIFGPTGIVAAGYAGWKTSNLMPWSWVIKRYPPFKQIVPLFRFSFVGTAVAFPFMAVQQYCLSSLLALDDDESLLAFHTKRFLIMQRSQMLFTKTSAREVTKEEQESLGAASLDQRKANAMMAGATSSNPGSVDVNLALQQQALTPVAQSGYGGK
jgi:hypothetical protein